MQVVPCSQVQQVLAALQQDIVALHSAFPGLPSHAVKAV